MLDPNEVAEVEALVEFVGICRYFAGERAINEMTQRALTELRQYLDNGTQALLEGLRHAGEADRAFRQSQVDAAVRFCAKVFGREYAALLGKAAEVAGAAEPKAARATKRFSLDAISSLLRIAAMIGRDVCPDQSGGNGQANVRLDAPVVYLCADDGSGDFVRPVAIEPRRRSAGRK
ncbi:MAG: hypothetical protein WBY67_15615 [Pseudolabrys sp.]